MSVARGAIPIKKYLLLLIFCATPFFVNLGANALLDKNEPWYAEPPREMVESGNYLIPTVSGFPRFRKPPLPSWIILGSYLLFGVNEFATRLPGAIAAALTILLTYLIGSRLLNRRAGFMAALILASLPRFFLFARFLHMDTFFTLFITAAIYFFLRAREIEKARYTLLAHAMIALAVLTKGPIGALIPLAVLALTAWGIKDRGLARLLISPSGIGILILLTLPWYLFMYAKFGGTFLHIHFVQQHLQRFFTPHLGGKTFTYYFIGEAMVNLLPWSPFMFPAAVFVLSSYWEHNKASPNQRLTLLPLFWVGFVLFFFSLSTGKREAYLMPLYPAIALTLGDYFTAAPYLERRAYRLAHQALSLVLVSALLGLGLVARQMSLALEHSLTEASLALGVFWLLAGALAWTLWTNRLDRTGLMVAGTTVTIVWTMALALPYVEPYRDVKALALQVRRQAGPSDLVGTYGTYEPSFQYYVARRPFLACSPQEMEKILHGKRRVFLLASAQAFDTLGTQSDIPLRILARGTILSFWVAKWFRENDSPFIHILLAVSRPLDSTVWQPEPSRPYLSCRDRARGQDHP